MVVLVVFCCCVAGVDSVVIDNDTVEFLTVGINREYSVHTLDGNVSAPAKYPQYSTATADRESAERRTMMSCIHADQSMRFIPHPSSRNSSARERVINSIGFCLKDSHILLLSNWYRL